MPEGKAEPSPARQKGTGAHSKMPERLARGTQGRGVLGPVLPQPSSQSPVLLSPGSGGDSPAPVLPYNAGTVAGSHPHPKGQCMCLSTPGEDKMLTKGAMVPSAGLCWQVQEGTVHAGGEDSELTGWLLEGR